MDTETQWQPPPLRRDLRLFQGPPRRDGSPTWTIHDPLRNRFFQIGWLDRTLLSHWEVQSVQLLAEIVRTKSGMVVSPTEIQAFAEFLVRNELTHALTPTATQTLAARQQRLQLGIGQWLLHHYLFFRIPLFCPDRFLRATLPVARFFGSKNFFILMGVLGCFGLYLTIRHWEMFQNTFLHFFSLEGAVWYVAAILLAKSVHELGHAYTARHAGCRVPTIGIAFMVLWPVLYTDVTDAWKLASRKKRLTIVAAGVIAELALALLATFLWHFLPDGPARSGAVLLATVSWSTTLALNLNPFMRFDGYYLLSNFLGIDNLQDRSFALARWHLRELLFGFRQPPPEEFSPSMRRFLTVFAFSTWIYRFLLFVGIALLVYHFVFKLAGIILASIELLWFISRPVWREWREWWKRREQMSWNRNTLGSLLILAGLVGLVVTPLKWDIEAPALLTSQSHVRLYAPVPARIKEVRVTKNQAVKEGETLLILEAPALAHEINKTRVNIKTLQWELDHDAANPAVLQRHLVLKEELLTASSKQLGLLKQLDQLHIVAPFSGTVRDMLAGAFPGRWCSATIPLIHLLDANAPILRAFVPEEDVFRIQTGATTLFYPNDTEVEPFPVRVVEVDHMATESLAEPYLASIHGGPIASRQDPEGVIIPEQSIFRITLEAVNKEMQVDRVLPGLVKIPGKKENLLKKIGTTVASVFIRESGF